MAAPKTAEGIAPGFLPVRLEWLGQHQEAALEPGLPIVDPHHHLWDNTSGVYLMPELLADVRSGHNIISTVFMECRAMYRTGGDPDLAPIGDRRHREGFAGPDRPRHR